jgi:zinc transport system ATP-binding protein
MNQAIRIEDVSFSYDRIRVLEKINLQLEMGEFFAIIGPNAAGKSTLVKLILGLLMPDMGNIQVLGCHPRDARGRIGYVPQHPTFRRDFPISVSEVVRLGQLGSNTSVRQAEMNIKAAMQAVELEEISTRQISTLSGGQLQRVLIARALACSPEILILDEPTANIDVATEANIFELLKQHNESMTIIVVSHDIAFISNYVDRVGCLNRTLICHHTDDISGKTIEDLYGTPVRMIHHQH